MLLEQHPSPPPGRLSQPVPPQVPQLDRQQTRPSETPCAQLGSPPLGIPDELAVLSSHREWLAASSENASIPYHSGRVCSSPFSKAMGGYEPPGPP